MPRETFVVKITYGKKTETTVSVESKRLDQEKNIPLFGGELTVPVMWLKGFIEGTITSALREKCVLSKNLKTKRGVVDE